MVFESLPKAGGVLFGQGTGFVADDGAEGEAAMVRTDGLAFIAGEISQRFEKRMLEAT